MKRREKQSETPCGPLRFSALSAVNFQRAIKPIESKKTDDFEWPLTVIG